MEHGENASLAEDQIPMQLPNLANVRGSSKTRFQASVFHPWLLNRFGSGFLPVVRQVGFSFPQDLEDGRAIFRGELCKIRAPIFAGENIMQSLEQMFAHHRRELIKGG